MNTHDFFFVFHWWLILFIVGLAFVPLATIFFSQLIDKGYAFSKMLGVVIISYIVYLLGTAKLLSFTPLSIYAVFLVIAIGTTVYFFRKKENPFKKISWKLLLFEELLFFVCLWSWSYVRGFTPEIYGLEKYMDLGFVNSILRAEYFPPKDMWFSPFPINYYYFGHFIAAVITKASLLPSFITYNLMIATVFALAFIESFSIGATLIKNIEIRNSKSEANSNDQNPKRFEHSNLRILNLFRYSRFDIRVYLGGLLSAALLTLAGNLHILYAFFSPYTNDKALPLWQLKFLPTEFPNSYWYPNATRFIYNTIHEFPIYSWVVADLHGHVSDIPIVLLTIAFLLSMVLQFNSVITTHGEKSSKFKVQSAKLLFIGFLLAVMYMTNAWDSIIYFLLTMFVFAFLQWQRVREGHTHNTTNNPILPILPINLKQKFKHFLLKHLYIDWIIGLFVYLFIIALAYLFFSFPFTHFFKAGDIVKGIGVVCAPKFLTDIGAFGPLLFEKDHCQTSPWWQLLTLYGFFYIWAGAFAVFIIATTKKVQSSKFKVQNLQFLTSSDIFVLLLILLSTILIIIPEFLYMKDIYPAHYRANTMFKLVFQSFMMLSISSAYIIMRTLNAFRHAKHRAYTFFGLGYLLIIVCLLTLVLTYPVMAIKSYYAELKTYKGLDGLAYIKNRSMGDYEAIMWLNKTVNGQPVIVEAQGDSYTDYARISSNTGLPTILGWTVHEWLWRGSYDVPAPRITEIQSIYESTDIQQVKDLLKKYHAQYVVIAELEREKYPNIQEANFDQLGEKVFESGSTKIYKLNF